MQTVSDRANHHGVDQRHVAAVDQEGRRIFTAAPRSAAVQAVAGRQQDRHVKKASQTAYKHGVDQLVARRDERCRHVAESALAGCEVLRKAKRSVVTTTAAELAHRRGRGGPVLSWPVRCSGVSRRYGLFDGLGCVWGLGHG